MSLSTIVPGAIVTGRGQFFPAEEHRPQVSNQACRRSPTLPLGLIQLLVPPHTRPPAQSCLAPPGKRYLQVSCRLYTQFSLCSKFTLLLIPVLRTSVSYYYRKTLIALRSFLLNCYVSSNGTAHHLTYIHLSLPLQQFRNFFQYPHCFSTTFVADA